MSQKAFNVARNYITYRYKRELVRKSNSTDEQILSLLECNNEEVKQENSNKNPTVNSVQRDYMAGEVSKDITRRFLLPPEIVEAHEKGIIHFHDAAVRSTSTRASSASPTWGAYWGAKSSRKTGSCPCCAVTSATATGTNGSSSTTVPTRRPCSTPRAALPSGPWSTSRWPRRMRRRPATACCGSDSTTPSPSGSGKTPAAA